MTLSGKAALCPLGYYVSAASLDQPAVLVHEDLLLEKWRCSYERIKVELMIF